MKAGPQVKRERLLVMAVTKLSDGVCVACLGPGNQWIRPTRQSDRGWRQLAVRDLHDAGGQLVVEVGNLVEWPLGAALPRDVHAEDVESLGRPVLCGRLSPAELLQRCLAVRAKGLKPFLGSDSHSLTLIEPQKITSLSFICEGKGTPRARLAFEHDGLREDLSVTDLQWRALGRRLLNEHQTDVLCWSPADLIAHAKRRIVYLAIGRGQPFEEQRHPLAGPFWPFVITVFTMPATRELVDYDRL